MRNLETIYADILKDIDNYNAKQEELVSRIEQLQTAMMKDVAAMNTAAQANDSEAYTRATADRAFHSAQLENAKRSKVEPIYNLDEANAIKREARDCTNEAYKPIYERMRKNRQEATALYEELLALLADYNKIAHCMKHRVMKEEKSFQMSWCYPLRSLDLFKHNAADHEFELHAHILVP